MSAEFLEIGFGRSYVHAKWQKVGGDIQILVTGGELPHIGSVAIAYIADGQAVASALTVPSHMETELAIEFARDICVASGCSVAVTCGIHINDASPDEIALLCGHARELKIQLAWKLNGTAVL